MYLIQPYTHVANAALVQCSYGQDSALHRALHIQLSLILEDKKLGNNVNYVDFFSPLFLHLGPYRRATTSRGCHFKMIFCSHRSAAVGVCGEQYEVYRFDGSANGEDKRVTQSYLINKQAATYGAPACVSGAAK